MAQLALYVNDDVVGEVRSVTRLTAEGAYELALYWPHKRVAVLNGAVEEASLRPVTDPDEITETIDFVAGMTDRYAISTYKRNSGQISPRTRQRNQLPARRCGRR